MKLTIIVSDGAVYLDDVSYDHLDMTGVPANIHALQWKDTIGWIEFIQPENGVVEYNALIVELPDWALNLLPIWDACKKAEEKVLTAIPVAIL